MKARRAVAAALGAAAVAIPATAHAVTYQPVSAADQSYAQNPANEPSEAGIDLVNLRGVRSATQFTVTQRYSAYRRVDYTRRTVQVVERPGGRGLLLEYRTGPSGSRPKVAFYRTTTEGPTPTTCAGARVTVSGERLVFVVPVACYRAVGAASAGIVSGQVLRYTAQTWTPGPIDPTTLGTYSAYDYVGAEWDWSGTQARDGA